MTSVNEVSSVSVAEVPKVDDRREKRSEGGSKDGASDYDTSAPVGDPIVQDNHNENGDIVSVDTSQEWSDGSVVNTSEDMDGNYYSERTRDGEVVSSQELVHHGNGNQETTTYNEDGTSSHRVEGINGNYVETEYDAEGNVTDERTGNVQDEAAAKMAGMSSSMQG